MGSMPWSQFPGEEAWRYITCPLASRHPYLPPVQPVWLDSAAHMCPPGSWTLLPSPCLFTVTFAGDGSDWLSSGGYLFSSGPVHWESESSADSMVGK